MKFCEHCGCQMPDDSAFCPECGAQAAAPQSAPAAQPEYTQPEPAPQYVQPPVAPQPPAYPRPPVYDPQPVQGDSDAEGHKFKAALSYLGILVLIPILADKDSAFSRYHANQGLILLIANAVLYVLGMICTKLQLGLTGLAVSLLSLTMFVFGIVGIVHAASGKMKGLPLIGKITLLK